MHSLFRSERTQPRKLWIEIWQEAFGPWWGGYLALFGILLFATGSLLPLADPDLGIHLATGEWIVGRGVLPYTEPFAWTRFGEPFYASSWLLEVLYFKLLWFGGAWALQLFQGLQFLAIGVAVAAMGRAFGWRPWTVIGVTLGSVGVSLGVVPFVRPYLVLMYIMPAAWALAYQAREAERLKWYALAFAALGALASNTHFLFPITAVPFVLFITERPRQRQTLIVIPAALVAGWLINPYALHLIHVLRLNVGQNLMLTAPMSVQDLAAGFQVAMRAMDWRTVLALYLGVLPWVIARRMSPFERQMHGALWLIGLVLFASVARALPLWWLLSLPMVGGSLELLPAPVPRWNGVARIVLVSCAALMMLSREDSLGDPQLRSGGVGRRYLPSVASRSVEPLARWLQCHTRKLAHGRVTTIASYGSFVVWRLPGYSQSIDGRTMFADSVAASEVYLKPPVRAVPVAPWKNADLAIVPTMTSLAPVLDSASAWHRVATTSTLDGPATSIGLWVRDEWWAVNGKGALPSRPVAAYHHYAASGEGEECVD